MVRRKRMSENDRRCWALSALCYEGSMMPLSGEEDILKQLRHQWWDLFIEGGYGRLNYNRLPARMNIDRSKKELAECTQVIGKHTVVIVCQDLEIEVEWRVSHDSMVINHHGELSKKRNGRAFCRGPFTSLLPRS